MKIKRIHSKRNDEEGYKVDFGLGKGKARRRVRLPSAGVFASSEQARAAYRKAKVDFANGQFVFPADQRAVSIEAIRDEWLRHLKASSRHPWHVRTSERSFEGLAKLLPLSSKAEELTTGRLGEFVRMREANGAARATSFKEMSHIRAACKHAVEHVVGLQWWKPPEKPEGIHRPRSRRDRVISREEQEKILAALRSAEDTDAADLFAICIGSGMRADEAKRLLWSDIHPEPSEFAADGWMMVRATKTAQAGETDNRPVGMTPRVAELIAGRYNGETRVFPSRINHARALKAACARAGIVYGREVKGGLVFHDTRHTAATRMLQAGLDIKTVGAILGHRNAASTLGYTHATAESRARAIAALN